MQYRKKPIIVDAFKWTGDSDQEEYQYPGWFIDAVKHEIIKFWDPGTPGVYLTVRNEDGTWRVERGDFIVRMEDGEIDACAVDIFNAMYEKIEV